MTLSSLLLLPSRVDSVRPTAVDNVNNILGKCASNPGNYGHIASFNQLSMQNGGQTEWPTLSSCGLLNDRVSSSPLQIFTWCPYRTGPNRMDNVSNKNKSNHSGRSLQSGGIKSVEVCDYSESVSAYSVPINNLAMGFDILLHSRLSRLIFFFFFFFNRIKFCKDGIATFSAIQVTQSCVDWLLLMMVCPTTAYNFRSRSCQSVQLASVGIACLEYMYVTVGLTLYMSL